MKDRNDDLNHSSVPSFLFTPPSPPSSWATDDSISPPIQDLETGSDASVSSTSADNSSVNDTLQKPKVTIPFKFAPSPPASPVGLTLPLIPCFTDVDVKQKIDRWNIPVFDYKQQNSTLNAKKASDLANISRIREEKGVSTHIGNTPPNNDTLDIPSISSTGKEQKSVATPSNLTFRRSLSAPGNKDDGSTTGAGGLCWQSNSLKGEYKMDFIDHLVKLQQRVNSHSSPQNKKKLEIDGSYSDLFSSFAIPSNGHSSLDSKNESPEKQLSVKETDTSYIPSEVSASKRESEEDSLSSIPVKRPRLSRM